MNPLVICGQLCVVCLQWYFLEYERFRVNAMIDAMKRLGRLFNDYIFLFGWWLFDVRNVDVHLHISIYWSSCRCIADRDVRIHYDVMYVLDWCLIQGQNPLLYAPDVISAISLEIRDMAACDLVHS
ncbi:hypothetical protein T4B_510 [Trichinella pseudospiralis]|uniref:Uncharacterized protein n=1 Tax=Trichinella pseudospiralis TaxID=6337 RepID=A0A0V1GRD7_TRIPS|nr:hypothetical protein T4B_510 [Trichinella pseudospiralis]